MPTAVEAVEKWSTQTHNGIRPFSQTKSITLKQWTSGYQWVKKNLTLTSDSLGDIERYYCPTGENDTVTKEEIKAVQNLNWNTFERFKRRAFNVWIIDMPTNSKNWIESTCSCPEFYKSYTSANI